MQETKAALTGTSDEPAPCASGRMCQGAAPNPSVQGLIASELKAIHGVKSTLHALALASLCTALCLTVPKRLRVCADAAPRVAKLKSRRHPRFSLMECLGHMTGTVDWQVEA